MRIVISTATWYAKDQGRVHSFQNDVLKIAAGHEVEVVPPEGDLLSAMANADVFFPLSGRTLTREVVEAGPNLKWIHVASAGVEHALFPELVESEITVTNAAGVYAIPIAEHVLAMMLALSRGIPAMVHQQDTRAWQEIRGFELNGATAMVVGLGGIGRRVARLCRAFEMRVLATRRRPENPDPDADRVFGPDELRWVLPEADWVILCAPYTDASQQLLSRQEIGALQPGCRIVNIARGKLIDEPALIEALQSGRVAGAALDVFESEPLPAGSPLWTMPNVLISPHTSGSSPNSLNRTLALFLDNLRRYLAGEPLRNVVDKRQGY